MCFVVGIAASTAASAVQSVYILYKVYYSGFAICCVFVCSSFLSESLLRMPRNVSLYTIYTQLGLASVGIKETRYRLDCLGFQLR